MVCFKCTFVFRTFEHSASLVRRLNYNDSKFFSWFLNESRFLNNSKPTILHVQSAFLFPKWVTFLTELEGPCFVLVHLSSLSKAYSFYHLTSQKSFVLHSQKFHCVRILPDYLQTCLIKWPSRNPWRGLTVYTFPSTAGSHILLFVPFTIPMCDKIFLLKPW